MINILNICDPVCCVCCLQGTPGPMGPRGPVGERVSKKQITFKSCSPDNVLLILPPSDCRGFLASLDLRVLL